MLFLSSETSTGLQLQFITVLVGGTVIINYFNLCYLTEIKKLGKIIEMNLHLLWPKEIGLH